jgi:single-strand DNA-binding protein
MPNLNKVMLMGNLTRDPEIREAGSSKVCEFGLAMNRKWKNKDDQEQEEVCFIDCTAWARTAEVIDQYFEKGKPIYVEGRLQLDQWQDKESGANRSKLKVVVERFEFLSGPQDQNSKPEQVKQAAPPKQEIAEDDIPF